MDDDTLRQRIGVVAPSRNPPLTNLGLKTDAQGQRHLAQFSVVKESDESQSASGALTEVRISSLFLSHILLTNLSRLRNIQQFSALIDIRPMELTFVKMYERVVLPTNSATRLYILTASSVRVGPPSEHVKSTVFEVRIIIMRKLRRKMRKENL